jgi:hypothetical protein
MAVSPDELDYVGAGWPDHWTDAPSLSFSGAPLAA